MAVDALVHGEGRTRILGSREDYVSVTDWVQPGGQGDIFRPRAVRAVLEVPVYLYLGGWSSGWDSLHPGGLLYLTKVQGDRVEFIAGSAPPGPPGTFHEGGFFLLENLGSFEDL